MAQTFTTDVRGDSDGVYSRAFDYSDEGVFSLLFGLGEKPSEGCCTRCAT